jgi:ABC-type sugar transport system ATPase subunit
MHVYDQIGRLLQKGAAVLLLTADPDEALGLADRVLVLQSGQLTLDRESAGLTKGQLEAAVAE